MACMEQVNAELKHKAQISTAHAQTPLEMIQSKMLSRGAACFKSFQKRFLIMDDDKSCRLSYDEFKYGLQDIGVHLPDDKMRNVFQDFDKDNSGSIDMTEFVKKLQPEMSAPRYNLVRQCFMMMDKTGDGVITVEDLVGSYNVKSHPKFLSGDWTERRVYEEFLKTFEAEGHIDGKVTIQDFTSYYACLSASIDHDAYFRLMMRNSWKHLDKDGQVF